MLYKLRDGNLITPPKTGTKLDGKTVSGYDRLPREELIAEGWKPLITEGLPPEETEYETYYEEFENEIVQRYEIKKEGKN